MHLWDDCCVFLVHTLAPSLSCRGGGGRERERATLLSAGPVCVAPQDHTGPLSEGLTWFDLYPHLLRSSDHSSVGLSNGATQVAHRAPAEAPSQAVLWK